uniref:Uncharacterized protein n=1 Tax=Oryza sativa subsp. japonica TaxID=39947 RepID=Q6Z4P1_ORYSJ|nr:hypothetical protein [Oryza sativa Japonica Group]
MTDVTGLIPVMSSADSHDSTSHLLPAKVEELAVRRRGRPAAAEPEMTSETRTPGSCAWTGTPAVIVVTGLRVGVVVVELTVVVKINDIAIAANGIELEGGSAANDAAATPRLTSSPASSRSPPPPPAASTSPSSPSAFPDDEPDSGFSPDDPDLLRNRPVPDRLLVVSAGVAANLLFAFLIIYTQALAVGVPVQAQLPGVLVSEVIPGSAAAGLPHHRTASSWREERGDRERGGRR